METWELFYIYRERVLSHAQIIRRLTHADFLLTFCANSVFDSVSKTSALRMILSWGLGLLMLLD